MGGILGLAILFPTVACASTAKNYSGAFVQVTEKIPGARCELVENSGTGVATRLYKFPVGQ